MTRARLEAARARMTAEGIDVLLLSVGADLPYLTGYTAMPLERVTMLVLPAVGDATLVVPALEAPRVEPGQFVIEAWSETDRPLDLIASLAGGSRVAAIGSPTWTSVLLGLQERLVETRFVVADRVMTELRICKDAGEIEALREAAAAADRVTGRLPEIGWAGRREREVARDIVDMMVEEGHQVAQFWIVASGPNGASPHHEPGERVIGRGDAVVVDFGGQMDGYCSDTTRTFVVGDAAAEVGEVHAVVAEAQRVGRETARAGVTAEAVDRAAREVIERAGYGDFFIHRLGHGIGVETHEHPYLVEGNRRELEPGMAFSIEPGIYLPDRFGVRIEDICVIDDDGSCLALNDAPRELMTVE